MIDITQFTPDMAPPSAQFLGMEPKEIDLEAGFAKVAFNPRRELINFNGVIQGGFLAAMMDDTMGFHAFVHMGMKSGLASIDLHTHFMRPVPLGLITVHSWVTRTGKSVAFMESKLFDMEDRLAARSTTSARLIPFAGAGKSS
ncbi:MAG: PaaI family thioesterase [Pseudomonadota bacterium]